MTFAPGRGIFVLSCDSATAQLALDILRSSPGLMVRQPLARRGSPLASCDYHAVSAPYSAQAAAALSPSGWGRGASGMPLTKTAFMLALEARIPVAAEEEARAEVRRPLGRLRDAALAAFRSDFSYCAQMAEVAAQQLAA